MPSGSFLLDRSLFAAGAKPAAPGVQCKLQVGPANDRFEQQADRVADQVMRMPEPNAADEHEQRPASEAGGCSGGCAEARSVQRAPASLIQRQESDEEPLLGQAAELTPSDNAVAESAVEGQAAAEELEDEIVPDESGMPKMKPGQVPVPGTAPRVALGQGQPMDAHLRGFMEARFGSEFASVRVHADEAAARTAQHFAARAFTVNNHVYFGPGEYAPASTEGRRLVAHELVHVLQQREGPSGSTALIQKKPAKAARQSVCSPGNCPQGKQAKAVRDDCGTSGPADRSNFITLLEVSISDRTVIPHWGTAASSKPAGAWPCSPRPGVTPTGRDVVGTKCSIAHTNRHRDGMAWFTGFSSTGLRIGFHDSQPVGPGYVSHGCVRVCCGVAKIIHDNAWSGITKIAVT